MVAEIVISVLIYGAVVWAVWTKAIQRELLDMNCPEGPDTKDRSVCRDGNGKLWAHYRVKKDDSPRASLAKIRVLHHNYAKAVQWRRCFVLSFVATLFLFLVTQQRLPSGFELLGSMLVIFIAWYMAGSFYDFHHNRFMREAIDGHLASLLKQLPRSSTRDKQ